MKTFFLLVTLISLASCSPKNPDTQTAPPTETTPASQTKSFDNVDPAVKQQFAQFLNDYFALNQALINDNFDNAKQAAINFAQTASKFEVAKLDGEQLDYYYMHSSNLKMALGNLGASPDIEKARTELATVSDEMYALVKAFHPNDTPLYYQYCPMARNNKGATWISLKKELENPYMGQMMLACGRTQETIN